MSKYIVHRVTSLGFLIESHSFDTAKEAEEFGYNCGDCVVLGGAFAPEFEEDE